MTEHPTTQWIHRRASATEPLLTPRERKLAQTIIRNRTAQHFGNVSADTLALLQQAMAERKMSMDQILYYAVKAYLRG